MIARLITPTPPIVREADSQGVELTLRNFFGLFRVYIHSNHRSHSREKDGRWLSSGCRLDGFFANGFGGAGRMNSCGPLERRSA